jgi:hypothetical protein
VDPVNPLHPVRSLLQVGWGCLEPYHATLHAKAETPSPQISLLGPITTTFLISSIDPPREHHLAVDHERNVRSGWGRRRQPASRDTFKSSGRLVLHSCPHRFHRQPKDTQRAGRHFPILVATHGAFAHSHTRTHATPYTPSCAVADHSHIIADQRDPRLVQPHASRTGHRETRPIVSIPDGHS